MFRTTIVLGVILVVVCLLVVAGCIHVDLGNMR